MIDTDLLYILSVLIPMLLMPVVLPMVVLMARRKKLTDNPNARKMQDRPVAVMGGTVIMLVICMTCIILNLFYDISGLFPMMCAMSILYIFGMLDDNIGLSWQFKLVMQVFVILMLFLGGNFGIDAFYRFFGLESIPTWQSCIITVFAGLVLLNAINFSDGIDGLASGLGVLVGLVMGYWNIRHGFVIQALMSFVVVGVMSSFFVFNVFSERYKMYMGDSGSLVLGLFIFISACSDFYFEESFLADRYLFSFFAALLSAAVFDMVRVVILRMLNGKSPFEPDRTHLHHAYVDVGMSHLLATIKIVTNNIVIIGIWYVTASTGMDNVVQLLVVLLSGALFIWGPYFFLTTLKGKGKPYYSVISKRCVKRSSRLSVFSGFVSKILDARRKTTVSQNKQ